VKNKIFILY